MIDLHIHTTYSDGTCSIKEILEKAEKLKLDYISITDHDTVKGYDELNKLDIGKYYSGKIINGVELKGIYRNRTIDILGYDIDIKKMSKWLDDFYKENSRDKIQTKYLKTLYDRVKKNGVKVIPFDEIKWNPENDWANVVIYDEITKFEENKKVLPEEIFEDYEIFRQKYCYNEKTIFYLDKSEDFPKVKQVVDIIHECGGKAFLAHPFIYRWIENKEKFILEMINEYGLDGVECYYSKFSEENIKTAERLAIENHKFRSGGSDYHGLNSPGIELGTGKGNLKVETDIIKQWHKE